MILDGQTCQVALTLNDLDLIWPNLIELSYFDHYIAENTPNIFFVSRYLPCALL